MITAPLPRNEYERLEALYSLQLLDTAREERFDAIARMAARVFHVPMAFVSLIDRERQWIKAEVGLGVCETAREVSFCSHAILQDDPLIVPDTRGDWRFRNNPLVTGEPFIRFYAGMPLRASGGQKIGTLCIADHQPREFSPDCLELLRDLGAAAERELSMAKLLAAQRELLTTRRQLEDDLEAAETYVRSLLPPPLTVPVRLDWRFLPSRQLGGDCLGYHSPAPGQLAFFLLDVCGHGVPATLLSVALLSTLRSQSIRSADFTDPASVLRALNQEFPMERHGNRFFTVWYGVLDLATRQLVWSGGGHPPALVIGHDGHLRWLETEGIPIGCFPAARYENRVTTLSPGDSLFLFSDGAFELRGAETQLVPMEDLAAMFARATLRPAPLDAILAELRELSGEPQFKDDVTLLHLQVS